MKEYHFNNDDKEKNNPDNIAVATLIDREKTVSLSANVCSAILVLRNLSFYEWLLVIN